MGVSSSNVSNSFAEAALATENQSGQPQVKCTQKRNVQKY